MACCSRQKVVREVVVVADQDQDRCQDQDQDQDRCQDQDQDQDRCQDPQEEVVP